MTKVRPPVSFHQAITRIAGRIGWDGCVAAVSAGRAKPVAERTIRNWSEPDTGALPSLSEALALDVAYRASGGGEAPIAAVFLLQLDQAFDPPADAEELVAATVSCARESGEAIAALVQAAQPGAPRQIRARAQQEAIEAAEAMTSAARKLGDTPGGPP